jgi:hypothetical protein
MFTDTNNDGVWTKSYDTNGGANTFFVNQNTGTVTVNGQSVSGSYNLTAQDSSAFLAKLWGGTLLSNGNLVEDSAGRTAISASNTLMKPIAQDAQGRWILDFGPRYVGGSEKYAFATEKAAQNFLNFLTDLDTQFKLADNII